MGLNKHYLIFFLLISCASISSAQVNFEVQHKSDSIIDKIDSLTARTYNKLDSIQNQLQYLQIEYPNPKTLKTPNFQIPPINNLYINNSINEIDRKLDGASIPIDIQEIDADSLKVQLIKVAEKRMEKGMDQLSQEYVSHADGEFKSILSQAETLKPTLPSQMELEQINSLTSAAKSAITELIEKNLIDTDKIETRLNTLKAKYDHLPNSEDLSSAQKRTWLGDKKLMERLVFSGNFTLSNFDPIEAFFNPGLGYRFNTLFEAGAVGITELSNNSKEGRYQTFGGGGYVRHLIFRKVFVQAEYNYSTTLFKESLVRQEQNIALGGLGYEITISHRVQLQTLVMYNFSHTNANELSPGPLIIRSGVRLLNVGSKRSVNKSK